MAPKVDRYIFLNDHRLQPGPDINLCIFIYFCRFTHIWIRFRSASFGSKRQTPSIIFDPFTVQIRFAFLFATQLQSFLKIFLSSVGPFSRYFAALHFSSSLVRPPILRLCDLVIYLQHSCLILPQFTDWFGLFSTFKSFHLILFLCGPFAVLDLDARCLWSLNGSGRCKLDQLSPRPVDCLGGRRRWSPSRWLPVAFWLCANHRGGCNSRFKLAEQSFGLVPTSVSLSV